MTEPLAGRRVLVLGATGFLGSAVVRHLLDAKAIVTALVRGRPRHSEFIRTRLYERTVILGGMIEDTMRVRQIISLHSIDAVMQCAGTPDVAATHTLTRSALMAAATTECKPTVVVPLRSNHPASHPRFQAFPNSRLDVAFVRLPDVFGMGDANAERWPGSLFLQASRGETLMPPQVALGCCEIDHAAGSLVAGVVHDQEFSPMGRWIDAAPTMTARDLYLAVRSGNASVATASNWYHENASRFGDRMSPRAAA